MFLVGVACYCSYMLGRNEKHQNISDTIEMLIKNGYLKTRRLADGELEIVKIED